MACEYFVNGEWVSENQLKEVLNNGLLDSLVSNGTVQLKDFKINDDKVTYPKVITEEISSIPAPKLQAMLEKEIRGRQGYPLNMLESLELNSAGTDFKIPLWSSPYASKFENILTSLINNKIVKQKFPGHSYVLGSEEGFRVKEGDEAAGDLAKSGIVFSKNFDPVKGLQPMRHDPKTGKMLPAQIMIPFKFRDENGQILDVQKFTTVDENGKTILDTTKIPEKVLQLFGFRIPTQERNSMAAIEIVGFLPEASGDLLLAPRDWVKQMGSDFDVDKLYTYMYNTFYKDGKLHTNFIKDKNKIKNIQARVENKIKEIKQNLELTKKEEILLDNYIAEKDKYIDQGEALPDGYTVKASEIISSSISKRGQAQFKESLEALNDAYEERSILKRSYKASRQNEIVDIHNKIMTSSNPEIVASIMALDSFGEFEPLAAKINKIRTEKGLVKQYSTILSDSYQRTKYTNATSGKTGVGNFSLDSTLNAMIQGKELALISLSPEERIELFKNPNLTQKEVLAANNPVASFGNEVSYGDLSNKYTIKSQKILKSGKKLSVKEKNDLKTKATIIRSLQSTAVDNEKAQILDKLNINNETFDAIRALTLLGFEENDIVGLITQEIIWEYISELTNARSSFSEFTADVEDIIATKLNIKYNLESKEGVLEADDIAKYQDISAEELMDDIKTKTLKVPAEGGVTPQFNIKQLVLLNKFMQLTKIGTPLDSELIAD